MTVKYTPDHEWIQLEDHEAAVVGITLHAQDALGDVVFVELPEVGRTYAKGDRCGGGHEQTGLAPQRPNGLPKIPAQVFETSDPAGLAAEFLH